MLLPDRSPRVGCRGLAIVKLDAPRPNGPLDRSQVLCKDASYHAREACAEHVRSISRRRGSGVERASDEDALVIRPAREGAAYWVGRGRAGSAEAVAGAGPVR